MRLVARSVSAALVCALATAVSACAVTPEGGEPAPGEGARETEGDWASTSQELVGEFTWSQGQAPRTMTASSNSVCVLTSVTGKLEGDKEWVRVVPRNGFWMLEGASNQSGVSARAVCYRSTEFQSGTLGFSDPSQDEYAFWNSCTWGIACGGQGPNVGSCRFESGPLWSTDSTAVLNGVGGRFDSRNQIAEVRMAADFPTASQVTATSCHDGREKGIRAVGMSFTSAVGSTAKYIGPHGVGDWSTAGEWEIDGRSGSVMMARTDQAICHFTHLSGNMRAAGDRVAIERRTDPSDSTKQRWFLTASALSTGAGVRVKARCYALDQRRFFLPPIFPVQF